MTQAQEQAANAARKACTAWLRSRQTHRTSDEVMAFGWRFYAERHPELDPTNPRTEYNPAYLAYVAAWRTTLETA